MAVHWKTCAKSPQEIAALKREYLECTWSDFRDDVILQECNKKAIKP